MSSRGSSPPHVPIADRVVEVIALVEQVAGGLRPPDVGRFGTGAAQVAGIVS